jgi:DNA gyrase/topoisomerase IV subunit B
MENERLRHEASLLSPTDVCAEILALSIVEYSYTPSVSITVDLYRAGGKISDNGRGIGLVPDRGDTISHAERAHTSIYPHVPANQEVASTLRELVWGERGPLGPALPAAACPFYEFVSERAGEMWSQGYRYGSPMGPPRMLGATTRTSGTTIAFETAGSIDQGAFSILVGRLASRIPGLKIAYEELTRPM